MALDIISVEDALVVQVPARFDANNAPSIETDLRLMLNTHPKKIIFDFSKTEYIASAGLRVLLSITRDAMKSGARVTLSELKPVVMKVFEMAGFTSIFTICGSQADALRKMA
jgi:anti-anti-sigma factor